MKIGEKIKKIRKLRGMTQAELANKIVTRNMISAIENGTSSPSLETLGQLAETLGVSAAYLVSENDDLFLFIKNEEIETIRNAFKTKDYKACIRRILRIGELDEELCYLLAVSNFEAGRNSLMIGSLHTADKHFGEAKKYSEMTSYDTKRIEGLLPLFCAITKNIQSPLLEFDEELYKNHLNTSFEYEFYRYTVLDLDYEYTFPYFQDHMSAKKKIKERDYVAALELLLKIEREKSPDSYNAYLMFGVYSDIENCYKQLYDFENAYRYSTKRISLLEGFNA